MKITYDITYNSYYKHWVVWKNIEKEKGCSCIAVFKGTRKECQQRLKELKNE